MSLAMPLPVVSNCDVYGRPSGGTPRTTVMRPRPSARGTSSAASVGTGFATQPRACPATVPSAMTTPSGPSPSKRSVTYWFFSALSRRRARMSPPAHAPLRVVCAAIMRKPPPPAIPWINRSGPFMSHGQNGSACGNVSRDGSSFAAEVHMRRTLFVIAVSAALAASGCMKKQADGTYKVDTAEAKAKTKTSGDELKTDLQRTAEKLKKDAEKARDSAAVRRAEEKAGEELEKAGAKMKEHGENKKP